MAQGSKSRASVFPHCVQERCCTAECAAGAGGAMAVDPAKNDEIWKGVCDREMMTWQSPFQTSFSSPSMPSMQDASYYRVPMPGEPVTVSGMRRRPELNGARGEIVNGTLDEFGRVTVRVFDNKSGTRRMKIQPFRLLPMSGSSSSPALANMGGFQDDRSSARSLSRAGSVVSSVHSRALGSAISAGARSQLSGARGDPAAFLQGTPGKTPPPSSLGRIMEKSGSAPVVGEY
mmetsp:Transcript_37272/g.65036  ORF Transcript_37272/g.65036 Transcript_37272/m.65036 type:complete len:232 (-) Transcript_37272:129-824(-)